MEDLRGDGRPARLGQQQAGSSRQTATSTLPTHTQPIAIPPLGIRLRRHPADHVAGLLHRDRKAPLRRQGIIDVDDTDAGPPGQERAKCIVLLGVAHDVATAMKVDVNRHRARRGGRREHRGRGAALRGRYGNGAAAPRNFGKGQGTFRLGQPWRHHPLHHPRDRIGDQRHGRRSISDAASARCPRPKLPGSDAAIRTWRPDARRTRAAPCGIR